MKKVAITGGLSCGKTTVCQFLKDLGAYVLSSDEIVHQLLSPETKLGKQIIGLLGQDIVTSSQQIDRKKIAQIIFDRRDLLTKVEEMIHPIVKEQIEHLYEAVKDDNSYSLFVVEVPLLFESSFETFFDSVVVVSANEDVALDRFTLKGEERQAYLTRMARQWTVADKAAKAHYVIENNFSLEKLSEDVSKLFQKLTA
ncbi:MAG: dephospho-CoA kinase [Parachlamydiales bacterium]|nr:dephospho-CoA kinase [Parachlamydiales bacterium]